MRSQPTLAESLLWNALRAGRLGGLRFRRQQVIEGFIVDLYCSAGGLVIELDGDVHDTQRESDHQRDAILAGLSLNVLRFSNREVEDNLPAVLARIRTAVAPRNG